MEDVLNLMSDILTNGSLLPDPKGIGNLSVCGRQLRFKMADGFPLVTTRRIHFSHVAHELIWFLSGARTVDYLRDNNVPTWKHWTPHPNYRALGHPVGDLGPVYGPQWTAWRTRDGGQVNQIANLIDDLCNKQYSKRLLVTAWNPEDLDSVSVAPCHVMFKCYVAHGALSLHVFQRATDAYIGLPYNIASYALLLHMLGQVTGLVPYELIHTSSDAHIYTINIDAARLQLTRSPKPKPRLVLNTSVSDIFTFRISDISLIGYESHPPIKSPVA